MSAISLFRHIQNERSLGKRAGVMSVCTAHPLALEAALKSARDRGFDVLIEATCNQVNQFGGYTGMQPTDFVEKVRDIAGKIGLAPDRILFGGDHLGPNPWRHLPADQAMKNAAEMVSAYVKAGFEKIHLDCTMSCKDDKVPLEETIIAQRAAHLCRVAETAAKQASLVPVYVIGSEVPPPGGAAEAEDDIQITRPEDVRETLRLHRAAFDAAGVSDALDRVIAIVVQPGVEFSNTSVDHYDRDAALNLSAVLKENPGLVFEAHSTDYQDADSLTSLVQDGFCILKVGPWLTYAMREALYDLDAIYQKIAPQAPRLQATMDAQMLENPAHWDSHYHGTDEQQEWLRHYSYSDRIRYYWGTKQAKSATSTLFEALDQTDRETLLDIHAQQSSQIEISAQYADARDIVIAHIQKTIDKYCDAVGV